MKKRMFKNCLIATMSLAVVGLAGVATTLVSADATDGAQTVTSLADVDLEMLKGASIRVDDEAVTGIRFSAKMDVNEWAWLKENYDVVKFGTFIMPAEYATTYGALTEENLFGASAKYFWEGKEEVGEQTEILQMYGAMYEYTDEAGDTYGRINGSILEVNPANYNRAFVGLSYVELKKGTETTYKFATANDNERTILYVAQRALEEEGWATTDEEYVNTTNFIQSYVTENPDAEVKYTVNKVRRQKDGSMKTESEERTAPFNSLVQLSVEEESEPYYLLDEKSSVMQGVAYAQDKLVLNIYYAFKISDETIALMGTNSGAYALDYFATENKWVMLSQGNYVGIVLQPEYLAKAVKNGVSELTVQFGNNEGSGFGFDITSNGLERPAGSTATNSKATVVIPLSTTTDYSAGLRLRFYQHDGVGPSCKSIWIKITEKTVAETALTVFRDEQYQTITYQGDNVWTVTKQLANVGYVVTKDYIETLIANGATGMVVKLENMDNDGSYIDSWYMSNSQGLMSANKATSDIATYEKVDGGCLWTVDFSKFIDGTAEWHCVIDGSKGGADFARAKEFDGVAFYLYMHKNTSGTLLTNVKVTITPIYAQS